MPYLAWYIFLTFVFNPVLPWPLLGATDALPDALSGPICLRLGPCTSIVRPPSKDNRTGEPDLSYLSTSLTRVLITLLLWALPFRQSPTPDDVTNAGLLS